MTTSATMDLVDRKILNIIQPRFPLVEMPFKAIGDEVGLSEAEVLERIEALPLNLPLNRCGAVSQHPAYGA